MNTIDNINHMTITAKSESSDSLDVVNTILLQSKKRQNSGQSNITILTKLLRRVLF